MLVTLAYLCNNSLMKKTSVTIKGTASVVSVPTPIAKVTTKAHIMAVIRSTRKANLRKGNKGNYLNADVLASAIVRADKVPTLTSVGLCVVGKSMPKTAPDGTARKEFAISHKVAPISFSDVMGIEKLARIEDGKAVQGVRPENAIRIRLFSLAKNLGLAEDTYYAIRADSTQMGADSKVYIVRR